MLTLALVGVIACALVVYIATRKELYVECELFGVALVALAAEHFVQPSRQRHAVAAEQVDGRKQDNQVCT